MAAMFMVLAVFLAVASATPYLSKTIVDSEYDANPQYSYSYNVQDPITGDYKDQFETRTGDVVKGRYSLAESDGTKRVVDYVADPINGFNAAVSKVPLEHHAVAPIVSSYAAHPAQLAYAAKRIVPTNYVTPYSQYTGVVAPNAYSAGYGYPYSYPNYGVGHLGYRSPLAYHY